jgi:HEAT repeat protein
MKRQLIALFAAMALLLTTPCFGANKTTEKHSDGLPLHLGILGASNDTGDPSLDWIPTGALELVTFSMAYMGDLVLVPIDEKIVSGNFPILSQLDALEIRHGLSVSLSGAPGKLTLTIRTLALQTDRELLILTLSGSKGHILSRLPEAASHIADSIGYVPESIELRWARNPFSSSPEAWELYTKAIYGPADKSEERLNAAIKADPNFAEARARLGMHLLERNEIEQAASESSKALKIKSYLYTALYSMGNLYARKGDRGKSERYYSALMRTNSRNRFFYTSKNMDEARNFLPRDDYKLLGPKAALSDLESPVYFEGAFDFLSKFRSHSDALKKTLKSPNIATRIMAMKAYEMSGIKAWDPKSWDLMQSDNFVLRALTAEAFSRMGGRSGCRNAIRSLTQESISADSFNHTLLARAIGSRCDSSSEPEIRRLLDVPDKKTRLIGACLLGMLGIRDEMDGIIEAVADRDLFMLATQALLASASEQDIGKIFNSIDNKPTASFIPLATIAAFDSEASTSLLSNAISHKNTFIRTSAVHALGASNPGSAARLLTSALSDANLEVRADAARALKEINRTSDAIPELIDMLLQEIPASKAAMDALAASGEAQAIKAVLSAMDRDIVTPEARASAISTLSGASSTDIAPLLSHKQGAIRQAALKRLARMEVVNLRDHLKTALSDRDENVRIAALEIITEKNLRDMAKNAVHFISSDISRERIAALGASALGGEQALDSLARAVAHKDPETRRAAALALGKTQKPEAISTLSVALKDGHTYVRIAAAEAFGNIRGRKSRLVLNNILDDPKYEVRIAALISLVKLGERTAVDTLAEQTAESTYYIDALVKASETLEDRTLAIHLLAALSMPARDMRSMIYKSLILVDSIDDVYRHLAATEDRLAFRELRTVRQFTDNISMLTEEKRDYPRAAGYYLMARKAKVDGDNKAARKYSGKAYKYAKRSGDRALASASLIMKAEAELGLHKPGSAMDSTEKAARWLRRSSMEERMELYSDLELSARIPLIFGLAYMSKGNKETAGDYLRRALSRAKLDRLLYATHEDQSSVIKEAQEALRSITGN